MRGGFDSVSFAVNDFIPNSELNTTNYQVAQVSVDPPTAAEIAETVEVQFTPEIKAKAQELGYNPVKIYEWVRNNVEFVPTYGSIQGANMCLQAKQCNDFDTASLLIALLRASNISAHYVYGTIEVPIDKVMNWVGGFTDPNAALQLIASGGIPVTALIAGGTISTVRMEHVWVEAWIDYIPSRGAVQKQGDTWIPLDASFKQYDYFNSINVQNATGVDTQNIYNNLKTFIALDPMSQMTMSVNLVGISNSLSSLQGGLVTYLDSNQSTLTVREVTGGRTIKQKQVVLLSPTLPYNVTTLLNKSSEIPDTFRYKIEIQMTDEYGFNLLTSTMKSLPELAGKKITISYDPATESDVNILKNYSVAGVNQIPAYLINLTPSLKIEGLEISKGTTVTMGSKISINLNVSEPNGNQDYVTHSRTAGEYSALVLNLGNIASALLNERSNKLKITKALLENGQTANITKDDLLGEMLNTIMLAYWAKSEFASRIMASSKNVAALQLPSESLNTLAVGVSYIWGIPYQIISGGMSIDIKRSMSIVVPKDGNQSKSVSFMSMKGSYDSYLESGVYDDIFQQKGAGVSAASIIKLSAEQGVPIYFVNANNLNNILPLLQVSSSVKNDIINAVNAGMHVIVPQTEISHNGWKGVGYVIIDPQTGSGAYMISGGMAGGWSPIDWFNNLGLVGKVIAMIIAGIIIAIVITLLVSAIGYLLAFLISEVIPEIIAALLYLSTLAYNYWIDANSIYFIKCLIDTFIIYSPPDPNPIPSMDDVPWLLGILMALMGAGAC